MHTYMYTFAVCLAVPIANRARVNEIEAERLAFYKSIQVCLYVCKQFFQ